MIDFTRYYDATSYLGRVGPLAFNVNQVFSAILVLASILMITRLRHAPARAEAPGSGSSDATPDPAV